MSSVFATALLAANFTIYPVFGDNVQPSQRVAETTAHIEAATDLGLIVELIVRCPQGTAIISYSKIEQLYCAPNQTCERDLVRVVARACGR